MADPLTPKVLFAHRVDSLEDEQQARELLTLVRSGQLGENFDPTGESMSLLLGRAYRKKEEEQAWRWNLVVDLARAGVGLNVNHFMLLLDRPDQICELLEAHIHASTDMVGTKVLLLELADAALTNGYIDTLEQVQDKAQQIDFDLYAHGMGKFLCHLGGNYYSTDGDVALTLASLDVLSNKPHFDVDRTYAGKTALFYCREPEIAQWLVDHGARLDLRGPKQETILGEAWKNQAVDEFFRILLENGAEINTAPDLEQVLSANKDPLSPCYPYLISALKRKLLADQVGLNDFGQIDTHPPEM